MKTNEKQLRETQVDDYSQLLPIFIYPSEQKSQSMYPDMDKVIEKCSQVIERHTIYLKKKEHVKWIEDSYFLVGKSRIYKMEYTLAEETFLYIYQAFKKDPNRYRGLNWLIRTYIETEQYGKAEEFLDIADEDLNKMPEELRSDHYAMFADFHLKKDDDRVKAILNLENAIKWCEVKAERRRYTFILAQLYQDERNFTRATELYSQVIKMNPPYTMRFNARINRAIAYDVANNNSDDIKRELKKMLKDKKNEEFRDQIYYAMAELVLKEGDEPLAVEYLRKSVSTSVNNTKQKALSYFKLAELYFARPNYVLAQAHYDSTLQFLPKDHPDYYEAETKNNDLQDLVMNLKVIIRQDSLLGLGELSEKDRKKKVNKIIKDLKDEEARREQAKLNALARQQAEATSFNPYGGTQGRQKGQWYFYNVTTTGLGLAEFKQIWGDRVLEDDWNRKKKNSIQTMVISQGQEKDEALANEEEGKSDSLLNAEKYDPEFYLKDIPVDFEDQLDAHWKIVVALFNVGTIFKESFLDYPSAIKAFKRVNEEYDTSGYNLPAHYQLYRIYKTMAEEELAEAEKKWIMEEHPFSEYAYLIKNPNYNKESKETKQKVEEFYQATYKLFQYELYADVISSCNRAEKAFSRNHLRPQFAFMKAKATGYTKDRETFRKELEYVVSEFPEDPVKQKAQEILDFMNKAQTAKPKTKAKKKTNYVYDEQDKYMFIFTADSKSKNLNPFKNKISNFNSQYFRESKLDITSSALGKRQLFLVRTFKSYAEAMRYYKAARNNSELILAARQEGAEEYVISITNFRLLFQSKDEQEYLEFFKAKYLNK